MAAPELDRAEPRERPDLRQGPLALGVRCEQLIHLPLRRIGPAEDEGGNPGDPQAVAEATLVADLAEAVDRGDEVGQKWLGGPGPRPVEADLVADDRPREGIVDARRCREPQAGIS